MKNIIEKLYKLNGGVTTFANYESYWKLKVELFIDINKHYGYPYDTIEKVERLPCAAISLVIQLFEDATKCTTS